MRDWEHGTPANQWTSMAVPSNGNYGVPEGLICGYPVTMDGTGAWEVVSDLTLDEFAQDKLNTTVNELTEEREVVKDLL